MKLHPQLMPWAPWLTLFDAELVQPVGELLLRLAPMLGPLTRVSARQQVEPGGVGDIVQRGSYERLLLTEWAYADVAPEEFIRRAANNELLFTGPEPSTSQRPLRSVALFDAGPLQLGEARLVHIAMFVLLARRAEAAGAEFLWGWLHKPGELHATGGEAGMTALLRGRTLLAADETMLGQWSQALGVQQDDCWLVGAHASNCPPQARHRVSIERMLLEEGLQVSVVQKGTRREARLNLPAQDACIRLLRHPFERAVAKATTRGSHLKPSLKYPPRFSSHPGWLAVTMIDGRTTFYRVPQRPGEAAGKARVVNKTRGEILAAGVYKNCQGMVVLEQGKLAFRDFPGPLFSRKTAPVERPDMRQFSAPPGAGRLLEAFHFLTERGHREWVYVLDYGGRLVRWQRSAGPNIETQFEVVSENVVGAWQFGKTLRYAYVDRKSLDTTVVDLTPSSDQRVVYDVWGEAVLRACFALHLYAFQEANGEGIWRVGVDGEWAQTVIENQGEVLGCTDTKLETFPGLLVLSKNRFRIDFCARNAHHVLITLREPAAKVSFDPISRRVAWIGAKSNTLTVQCIDDDVPLLTVVPLGEGDDE
ncbi:hypothetical protein [Pseudoduganella sp. HUAS MS19]